jgi:hypothetical protein
VIIATVIRLLANSIGLIIAWIVLPRFSINADSFIVAVLIFTVVEVLAEPLLRQMAVKNVPALMGSVSLITTFIGLLLTNAFTSGLYIKGASTWVLATLIVWLAALIAGLILPLFIAKRAVNERRN